jgi:hypothetical protein
MRIAGDIDVSKRITNTLANLFHSYPRNQRKNQGGRPKRASAFFVLAERLEQKGISQREFFAQETLCLINKTCEVVGK